ncbi:hypothetical protein GCM10010191_56040 [Actinomadura vinacea]|uniref:DUF732 domain-containing protein n=1 Tax=Actinomadura vinacea TaxID=115336 RepID=A0ABP5WRI3_9ACTN
MDLTRGRTLAVTLILALACGCGSGAVSGGSPDEPGANAPQNNSGNNPGGGGGGGQDTDYGPLELPVGNTGVNASSGLVYEALQAGNCAGARAQLAKAPNSVAPPGPEAMRLLRVGIALCERRGADAKSAFAGLSKPTEPQFMCFLYRAAASLIKRRPVSAFGDCPTDPSPGGSSPDVETPTPEPSPPESPSETPSVEATG